MPDLTFLGIGSAFCPVLKNTAAFLRRGNALYVLDFGSTVFGALHESGALEKASAVTVLVTHTHADHIGSLGTLISWCRHVCPLPVTVVHPDDSPARLLRLNGITEDQYTLHTGPDFNDGALQAHFIAVPHTRSLTAYGILLADRDERIYYSGDAGDIPPEIWNGFLSGDIARVYQDMSLSGAMGGAHADYHWFLAHCPPALRGRLFPIHLDQACLDSAKKDGFGLALR